MGPVLVTGASGFLGKTIMELLRIDDCVYGTGGRKLNDPDAFYSSVDLMADELHKALPNNIQTVIHTAGVISGDADVLSQNITMTQRVVDWSVDTGVACFVLVSSAAVYAPSSLPRSEDFRCEPLSLYGQSKLDSEEYLLNSIRGRGVRAAIVRIPALVGPTTGGNIARLIRAIMRNRFVLLGDGENRKSLISVDDAARACCAIAHGLSGTLATKSNSIFNLTGGDMTMMQIVSLICEELGRSAVPKWPAWPALWSLRTLKALRLGGSKVGNALLSVDQFMRTDLLDARLIEEQIGFRPQVDIRHVLRDMVHAQCALLGK